MMCRSVGADAWYAVWALYGWVGNDDEVVCARFECQ